MAGQGKEVKGGELAQSRFGHSSTGHDNAGVVFFSPGTERAVVPQEIPKSFTQRLWPLVLHSCKDTTRSKAQSTPMPTQYGASWMLNAPPWSIHKT